jgi:adenine-specific DNA methylase
VTIDQLAKILAAALAGGQGAEVEINIKIRIGGDGQVRSLDASAKASEKANTDFDINRGPEVKCSRCGRSSNGAHDYGLWRREVGGVVCSVCSMVAGMTPETKTREAGAGRRAPMCQRDTCLDMEKVRHCRRCGSRIYLSGLCLKCLRNNRTEDRERQKADERVQKMLADEGNRQE